MYLKPRWIAKFFAHFLGYFWLPCPICQKPFAGYEIAGFLKTNAHSGNAICPNCVDEADRRNKILLSID